MTNPPSSIPKQAKSQKRKPSEMIGKLDLTQMPYDRVEAVGAWIGVHDVEQTKKIVDKINQILDYLDGKLDNE